MKSQVNYLNIYQIYFNEETKKKCFDKSIKVYNKECNEYFENQVIIDHVPHSQSVYTGVISWKFQEKTVLRKTYEDIENNLNCDVLSIFPHMRNNQIIKKLEYWHPTAGDLLIKITNKLGYDFNMLTRVPFIVYHNHFICRTEIYKDYVNSLLLPAMDLMKNDKSIQKELWQNSGYKKELPEHTKKSIGVNYYPLHTFICERLFSLYLIGKNYDCKHF